jgi:anti-anti-sigma factor
MKSNLKNSVEQVQDEVLITTFHLSGRLDINGEEDFVKWASDAYQAGARYLLLDMSEVTMLTSAGMRAIQKVYRMFTTEDSTLDTSQLKMAAAPPPVYEPLKMTGFLKTIPVFETVQSAIAAFKKQAA